MDYPSPSRVALSEHVRDTLLQESRAAYPKEACGVLLGSRDLGWMTIDSVVPCRNLSERPDSFFLDPGGLVAAEDLAAASGKQLLGFWHSHPDAPAVLSERDRAGGWPDAIQMIVSISNEGSDEPRLYLEEASDWVEVSDLEITRP